MLPIWKKISRMLRTRPAVIILIFLFFFMLLSRVTQTDQAKPTISQTHGPPSKTVTKTTTKATTTTTPKSVYTIASRNGTHVNPYPFHFTILPKPCSDEELVIVVHSAVQYFKRRALMRSTWLNRRELEKELNLTIKIVFITGMTTSRVVKKHIRYEQEFYGDIVQSSFIDSYVNNTYKAISFLRWVSSDKGCPKALMVLKVDDDALVHQSKIPKLKKSIDTALSANNTDVYSGRLLTQLVNRNNQSKWYVSWDLWPHKLYPVWFQGLAYLITPSLAAKLPAIALDTKYMFTDDVYVGVLVSQVEGAKVIVDNMFGIHTEGSMEKFRGSFLLEGKVFYHVPNISHFIQWYYIDSDLIRYDPLPTTPHTPKSNHLFSRTHPVPLGLYLVILLSFALIFTCCYINCYDECSKICLEDDKFNQCT